MILHPTHIDQAAGGRRAKTADPTCNWEIDVPRNTQIRKSIAEEITEGAGGSLLPYSSEAAFLIVAVPRIMDFRLNEVVPEGGI